MKALIVSMESFQKGEIPEEVKRYIVANKGRIFTILDESSKIKTNEPCKDSKKSKRTQAILQLGKIGQRCILTGTFMSKTPVNAYDQMNFLCPGFFPESMHVFAEKYEIRRNLPMQRGARVRISEKDYFAIRKRLMHNKYNSAALLGAKEAIRSFYGVSSSACDWILEHEEYTPFRNLDELWERIGNNCLKVAREDLYDLPPKIYKTVPLTLTSEQKKLYLQLQNKYCTDHITVDNGLKLYLRFQDVCNGYEPYDMGDTIDENGNIKHNVELVPLSVNPKLDALEECVEEIGNEQAVIWCSRTQLLNDARKRMEEKGYTCGTYNGQVTKEEREEDYDKFTKKTIQLLFVNQASGAYGLDGLKEANYAIYLSNSYSVEQRQQSEDRIYRGQVKNNKTIIDLSFKGTCEDRVTEALKQGKELLDTGTADSSLFILNEKEIIF